MLLSVVSVCCGSDSSCRSAFIVRGGGMNALLNSMLRVLMGPFLLAVM